MADDTREITLVYNGPRKTETFVGVLQQGYKAKLKDGSLAEVKVSLTHIGGRMKVYYMAKERRVSGRKEGSTKSSESIFWPTDGF